MPEDRQVRTLTIHRAEHFFDEVDRDAKMDSDRTGEFLVYLALFAEYFPLLRDLRLVCDRDGGGEYSGRYRIVDMEAREWYTDECKWMLPQIEFTGGDVEWLAQNVPKWGVRVSREHPSERLRRNAISAAPCRCSG